MNDFAIRADHVAKRFLLGGRSGYSTLRESMMSLAELPGRVLRRAVGQRSPESDEQTLWALRDISFDIRQGEVVGIIGRNGAGKSTLLKVLARITQPSEGSIELTGRVASLLEVGTGFHHELSGRENIFLNGAILGMTRAEILKKFDEIVAFSEVERFLDTPVKRYSSGMYMRLAFAVAAHLDPEILIVDEVLAVGDATFQKKCLGKMSEVAGTGRTVLFVSHNMSAITRLCGRAILLDAGRIVDDGPSYRVSSLYLRSGLGTTAKREWTDPATRPGNQICRMISVCVRDSNGQISESIDIRYSFDIEMEYEVLQDAPPLVPNYTFHNDDGTLIGHVHELDPEWRKRRRPPGRYVSKLTVPANLLNEGSLIIGAAMSVHDPVQVYYYERDAVAILAVESVGASSLNLPAARGDFAGPIPGVIRPLFPSKTEFYPAGSTPPNSQDLP